MTLCALAWASAPTPAAAQGGDSTAYARRLGELVDRYRATRGLPALAPDPAIAVLALEHSQAMAKAKLMSHDDFPSRVRRSGSAMCVENVGWNYPTADRQLDAWRASPGHDRNLVDRRVDRVGIGVADGYVTLIACGK